VTANGIIIDIGSELIYTEDANNTTSKYLPIRHSPSTSHDIQHSISNSPLN